ncbi:hypothetical protein PPERSA_08650 [Pseudocohnilembus persalinus]|uniref:Uncharacterized protein n=1 Tax=Pseudocohnilembus persalinus TaxID=266149 RepID=A0A0V0R756_PSEPJ|nr:hypothetical protein PPERSA_08650 [Pseudocohnilembus persalinus]|eukprot:KRX10192.1 hypothetical protein PPERSA_08650 [Pseudocohnilembus persalinus]
MTSNQKSENFKLQTNSLYDNIISKVITTLKEQVSHGDVINIKEHQIDTIGQQWEKKFKHIKKQLEEESNLNDETNKGKQEDDSDSEDENGDEKKSDQFRIPSLKRKGTQLEDTLIKQVSSGDPNDMLNMLNDFNKQSSIMSQADLSFNKVDSSINRQKIQRDLDEDAKKEESTERQKLIKDALEDFEKVISTQYVYPANNDDSDESDNEEKQKEKQRRKTPNVIFGKTDSCTIQNLPTTLILLPILQISTQKHMGNFTFGSK